MPDWSYQTVFRPALTRMPLATARRLVFGFFRRLTALPAGGRVIDLLGHMAPDRRLRRRVGDLEVPTPVGLAAGIDVSGDAGNAFTRFGFGLLEFGPVTLGGAGRAGPVRLDRLDAAVISDRLPETVSIDRMHSRLRSLQKRQPVLVRLLIDPADAAAVRSGIPEAVDVLGTSADGFTLQWLDADASVPATTDVDTVTTAMRAAGWDGPMWIHVAAGALADRSPDAVAIASRPEVAGLLIDGATLAEDGTRRLGTAGLNSLLSAVQTLRAADPNLAILSAGCVHEPWQACVLMDAGADTVLLDSGLIFGGPGLPKRIHETLLARDDAAPDSGTSDADEPVTRQTWFWTLLLAIAMLFGGALALTIATTRVVLPYDEALVGMSRDELCAANDRLLPFLTHDRVTLAGTMLADGILYFALSVWGIRCGWHWARVTVLASSLVGFFSFFLFLGFGYFDPFHAFVTAILFQFVLFAAHSQCSHTPTHVTPDWSNDRAWRAGLWGQLLYIVHGTAVITAGVVIACVGISSVFVPEDLDFMQTTVEALSNVNPRLIPMIAHDRASFGGMLISCGIVTLLTSLWGFRRGAAWVWWSLTLAGTVAYATTIAVHLAVGYTSVKHLLPAYGGLSAIVLAALLCAPYLLNRGAERPDELIETPETPAIRSGRPGPSSRTADSPLPEQYEG